MSSDEKLENNNRIPKVGEHFLLPRRMRWFHYSLAVTLTLARDAGSRLGGGVRGVVEWQNTKRYLSSLFMKTVHRNKVVVEHNSAHIFYSGAEHLFPNIHCLCPMYVETFFLAPFFCFIT